MDFYIFYFTNIIKIFWQSNFDRNKMLLLVKKMKCYYKTYRRLINNAIFLLLPLKFYLDIFISPGLYIYLSRSCDNIGLVIYLFLARCLAQIKSIHSEYMYV